MNIAQSFATYIGAIDFNFHLRKEKLKRKKK